MRLLAAVLALLAASPFTAPFSACRLSALVGPGREVVAAPATSPVLIAAPGVDRSYPPQSVLDEHFKDGAVPQLSWVVRNAAGVVPVIVSHRVAPRTAHAAPSVLRV